MFIDKYIGLGRHLNKGDRVISGEKTLIEKIDSSLCIPSTDLGVLQLCHHSFSSWLQSEQVGYDLPHRIGMEKLHYSKLRYSLSHALAENFYYLNESVLQTRRAVAVSSDCISSIQAICRGNVLHLIVYMRSSHYINLLPVDLLFLTDLPRRYLLDAASTASTFECDWPIDQIEKASISLHFGSLHMDAGVLPKWLI